MCTKCCVRFAILMLKTTAAKQTGDGFYVTRKVKRSIFVSGRMSTRPTCRTKATRRLKKTWANLPFHIYMKLNQAMRVAPA